MNTLRAIWWKIYPNDDRHRWLAVLWLPFMIWFFLDPFWKHLGRCYGSATRFSAWYLSGCICIRSPIASR